MPSRAESCRVRMHCAAAPGGSLLTAGLSLTIAESAAATEVPSRCRAGRVVPSEVQRPGGSLVAAVRHRSDAVL
jgi:hypothetical protein